MLFFFFFPEMFSYLFNCSEDTRRIVTNNKIKFSGLENIFVTRTNWSRIGGIPSVVRHLEDLHGVKAMIHGPPKLVGLIKN